MSAGPNLDAITLAYGPHDSRDKGVCAMEAVAWLAGEPHSDQPACTCPVLAAFVRGLNDTNDAWGGQAVRDRLKPLLPRMIGTADDGRAQERGLAAADWLIRTYTPAWLRLAGLDADADALAGLARVGTWDDVERALPTVQAARKSADAAWAAAWDAAWDAARDAAWDAARDAAWDAARAAGAAAGDAAWAAGAAAGDAAWAAARDAARAALRPTVTALHDSAFQLLEAMLPPEAAK